MGLKFYLIILTRNYLCFGFLIVEEFLLIKQHSTYSIVHKLESNAIELETFLSCSKAPTFFLYIPIPFKPPSAFISREFLVLVPLTIRETTHFLFFCVVFLFLELYLIPLCNLRHPYICFKRLH